ncbi:MAG: Ig-like domain-containing protein [Phycisphaerae bacterium]|nr:PKD domain-containing protein [Phycisphaerae bacterium]NUQ46121.1 Ig-like domain-containing protein [Phycisphaerae bacterium]
MFERSGRISEALLEYRIACTAHQNSPKAMRALVAAADRWWSAIPAEERLKRIRAALDENPNEPRSLVSLLRQYEQSRAALARGAPRPSPSSPLPGASPAAVQILTALVDTISSPSLESLSLSGLAQRMEVQDMSLWSRVTSFPRILKELHLAAWRWPVFKSITGRIRLNVTGSVRREHRSALAFIACATVSAAPVAAADLVFSDGTLNPADWSTTVVTEGDGGTYEIVQEATGNPGTCFRTTIHVEAATTAYTGVYVFSFRSGATYDPSASGAIQSVDYSEDFIHQFITNGCGQGAALAIRQGGTAYTSPVRCTLDPSWTTYSESGLTESDFVDLTGQLHPDFSANGSVIEFGFFRGNSHGLGNGARTSIARIDNWSVTIHQCMTTVIKDLGFNVDGVLPSADPEIFYYHLVPPQTEQTYFAVSDGVLQQRTFGVPGHSPVYRYPMSPDQSPIGAIHPAKTLSLEARIKVLQAEQALGGVMFEAFDGSDWYGFTLASGGVYVTNVGGGYVHAPVNVFEYHTYRLEAEANSNVVSLFIDGSWALTTNARALPGWNGFQFGTDYGVGFVGANADWDYVRVWQCCPGEACPPPCTESPTASAGDDQSVPEGSNVQLDASGSTIPCGTPGYSWTQIAGPVIAVNGPDTASPTFDAPEVPMGGAVLTFQLVVSDGTSTSEPDVVNVTVTNINHAPVVVADDLCGMTPDGEDLAVAEGGIATLDASNSYDEDDEPLTYTWMQTAGTPVALDLTDPAKPTFTAPLVGVLGETLTFELTVSDGLDISGDTVDVCVENVNHAPIAHAGDPQTVAEGSAVVLDASASNDPDGDTLTYEWTQFSGPAVTLSDPASATPSFTAPQVGAGGATLVFRVTVDDGYFGSDDAEVTITVQDANSEPFCDLARPSVDKLWPPNHKLVAVSILGVTDPENNDITITILDVTQDEPINGLGDGDTAPDAVIQGSTVLLRAERAGGGNGRVYHVTFLADDGFGGMCIGTVTVTVPHDKGRNAPPAIDDGQIYGSTGP